MQCCFFHQVPEVWQEAAGAAGGEGGGEGGAGDEEAPSEDKEGRTLYNVVIQQCGKKSKRFSAFFGGSQSSLF